MTDLRTYRADHLIPEDAFPGTVIVEEATLMAELGMIPEIARPYVDIDAPEYANHKQAILSLAKPLGFDPEKVKGKLSVAFINSLLTQASLPVPPIDATQATLERGYSFVDLGKMSFHAQVGSRYFVVKDIFDIYSRLKYKETAGASEEVMGKEQEDWFLKTITGSKATWKVWGNEYTLNQIAIDLTALPINVPEQFQRRFYLDADAWDGSRNKRAELLDKLAGTSGVVAITGDIHSCFAGTPALDDAGEKRIVEFVGTSISSSTFQGELKNLAKNDPVLSQIPGAELLADNADAWCGRISTRSSPSPTPARTATRSSARTARSSP